jgi:hypothetical protein
VIRSISYASCYVCSPTGSGAVCERSRLLRALLKAGDANFILKYALRVRQQADESPPLSGFFGATDVLVPVPGSRPYRSGDVWAAEHLAIAMVNEGLGGASWAALRRTRAVRKSAGAEPGRRPSVSVHYESFSLESPCITPDRILLVDDVITKGRTLLAAAMRLHEAFPRAEIRAFALVRTLGFVSGVRQLLDPCQGEIRWRAGDALRDP